MSAQVQESLLDVAEEPVLGSLEGAVRRVPLAAEGPATTATAGMPVSSW